MLCTLFERERATEREKETLITYVTLITFRKIAMRGPQSSSWAPVANGSPCGLPFKVLGELQGPQDGTTTLPTVLQFNHPNGA